MRRRSAWSSTSHLIVGIRARSATSAQALPMVRQNESWSDDDKQWLVSIGPAQSSIAILPKSAVDVVEKCKKIS
jgi:hypothetical protein